MSKQGVLIIMGIFGTNYSKPGPGIDKDAPQKKGIFRFFEIFFRKFSKLTQLNMLAILVGIPFIAIAFIIMPVPQGIVESLALSIGESTAQATVLIFRLTAAMLLYVLWGSGPVSAAYAYISRCFTREEHAWLVSDGKDKFVENFKQGIIVTVIDFVMLYVLSNGLYFYYTNFTQTGENMWLFVTCILAVLTVLYTFMHLHIYQLMVTFENTLPQLYRNAFLLALSELPMNIILTAIAALGVYVLFGMMRLLFGFTIFYIIGLSILRFPIEYTSSRAISRKILANIEDNEKSIDTAEGDD